LIQRTILCCVAFLTVAAVSGCSDKDDKVPKIQRIEGVAKEIDLAHRHVAMSWVNKRGQTVTLEGSVRDDTEVWINGRAHQIEDIREGDRIVVEGYREGRGDEQSLVATKIEVTRAQSGDWKKAGDGSEASVKAEPTETPS